MPFTCKYFCSYINKPQQHKVLVWNAYGGVDERNINRKIGDKNAAKDPEDVEKILFYAQIFPSKLPIIASFLEKCILEDSKDKRYVQVSCGAKAMQKLMDMCPEYGLSANQISESVFSIIHLLLRSKRDNLVFQGIGFLLTALKNEVFPQSLSLTHREIIRLLVEIVHENQSRLIKEAKVDILNNCTKTYTTGILYNSFSCFRWLRYRVPDNYVVFYTSCQSLAYTVLNIIGPLEIADGSSDNTHTPTDTDTHTDICENTVTCFHLYATALHFLTYIIKDCQTDAAEHWNEVMKKLLDPKNPAAWAHFPQGLIDDILRHVALGLGDNAIVSYFCVLKNAHETNSKDTECSLKLTRGLLPTIEVASTHCQSVLITMLKEAIQLLLQNFNTHLHQDLNTIQQSEVETVYIQTLDAYCLGVQSHHRMMHIQAITYTSFPSLFNKWQQSCERKSDTDDLSRLLLDLFAAVVSQPNIMSLYDI